MEDIVLTLLQYDWIIKKQKHLSHEQQYFNLFTRLDKEK